MTPLLQVFNDLTHGTRLTWRTKSFGTLNEVAIRVEVRGQYTFSVWNVIDSGEEPPTWAEKNLHIVFFGSPRESPGYLNCIEAINSPGDMQRVRLTSQGPRGTAEILLALQDDELSISLTIEAPAAGPTLPICYAELLLDDIGVGAGAMHYSAHPFAGRVLPAGLIAEAISPGVPAVNGCIGLALPLVYLYQPDHRRGIEMEFLMPGRPTAWVRRGKSSEHAILAVCWTPDRLLAPGEAHHFGGKTRLRSFSGTPIERMRAWRDDAADRYGLIPPESPQWARRCNIIEFNMNPENSAKGFTRLDDPKCRDMLKRWADIGYNAIFAVSCNNVGHNWLSPLDYDASSAVGGAAAEQTFLAWAREAGFHVFLWITTVGLDSNAPEVAAHSDWFTRRANGSLFYAWSSKPETNFTGYAPDADPLATGWRTWLKNQTRSVIGRGYAGVFVDGLIPRASNHSRWAWPGEGRDSVVDQTRELADYVRTLGGDLITFVEDESPVLQAAAEMTMGRYSATMPFIQRPHQAGGMGGGPAPCTDPASRIPAEKAREYLLIRYASLLPGVLSNDVIEGYQCDADGPWIAQSLLCGAVPKTHSEFVDDPATFRPVPDGMDVPANEREPSHRLAGHGQFISLLKFCRDEPAIRTFPLSIEGVHISGDEAVVGILRPAPERCILALINFANRASTITASMGDAADIPKAHRERGGRWEASAWEAREICLNGEQGSLADPTIIEATLGLTVSLAAYGLKIFELKPPRYGSQ